MPKRSIPKHLIAKMDPKNEEWFNKYKLWNDPKSKNYRSAIERFLVFHYNVKPFTTIDKSDVETFRNEIEPYIGKSNYIIYALLKFKEFLVSEQGIKDDFLNDLKDLIIPSKNDPKGTTLNLEQIGHIRKYNKDDINDEYIFEVFFQLGIKKDELKYCHPQYKVENKQCFVYENKGQKKEIKYNAKIAELLEKVEDSEELRLKFHNADDYLKKVTGYLSDPKLNLYESKRQIRKIDLKSSHEAHFIKCPNCHISFENAARNWVLAKVEGDEEFYLVCSQCKGEPQHKGKINEN